MDFYRVYHSAGGNGVDFYTVKKAARNTDVENGGANQTTGYGSTDLRLDISTENKKFN